MSISFSKGLFYSSGFTTVRFRGYRKIVPRHFCSTVCVLSFLVIIRIRTLYTLCGQKKKKIGLYFHSTVSMIFLPVFTQDPLDSSNTEVEVYAETDRGYKKGKTEVTVMSILCCLLVSLFHHTTLSLLFLSIISSTMYKFCLKPIVPHGRL